MAFFAARRGKELPTGLLACYSKPMDHIVQKAKLLALRAHKDQKYGEFPYSKHLEDVVTTLSTYYPEDSLSETVLAAAWLHDTIEDTGWTFQAIFEEFGRHIARIVFACTDEPGANRKEIHLYHVYMLKCRDNSYYTGIAKDVEKRLNEHRTNKSRGSKYVRSRLPVELVYVTPPMERGQAQRLEISLKKLSHHDKKEIVTFYAFLQAKGALKHATPTQLKDLYEKFYGPDNSDSDAKLQSSSSLPTQDKPLDR